MKSPRFTSTFSRVSRRKAGFHAGFRRAALLSLILAGAGGGWAGLPTDSAGGALSEYEIKAAYLYNFAKFVEWPPEAFPDRGAPLTIAILGNDEFGTLLENGIQGKTVNDRPLLVRRLKWPAELRAFQMVFIGASEERQLPQITGSIQGVPVLTVTEMETVTRSKCVINFVLEGKKVRFEVDMNSAEQAHLKISSKLLMLAHVFRDGRLEGKK